MSGRSRRKKLQRAKRISPVDGFVSPTSEAVTTLPLSYSPSDTITLSANEADLGDITSNAEKLEKIDPNKEEKGEKEAEGNEKSSSISEHLQPQLLIPCGPSEINVDSLQKAVDSDESATPVFLCETNNPSKITDDSLGQTELCAIKAESPSNTDIPSVLNPTSHKNKGSGRIIIAKSDTIIETREVECFEIENEITVDDFVNENNSFDKCGDNFASKSSESVSFEHDQKECVDISILEENSIIYPSIAEIETNSVQNEIEVVTPNDIVNTRIENNPNQSGYVIGFNASQNLDISLNKDWNVIVEEDESDSVITEGENNEKTQFLDSTGPDIEPILIKVKSFNLPKTETISLLNSKEEEPSEKENISHFDIHSDQPSSESQKGEKILEHKTPEIIVVDDYKENASTISTSIQIDTSDKLTDNLDPTIVPISPSFSSGDRSKESSQGTAIDVADLGDGGLILPEQHTTASNPKWRRAATKAVKLQESSKKISKQSCENFIFGHEGSGDITFPFNPIDSEKYILDDGESSLGVCSKNIEERLPSPPIILEGGIQYPPDHSVSPASSRLESPSLHLSTISGEEYSPTSDIPDIFSSCHQQPKSSNRQHEIPLLSRPTVSSHSSVLVDMGKVIGVLRSTRNQAPAALQGNIEDNSDDGNENDNISNQNFMKSNVENRNENFYTPDATNVIEYECTNGNVKCESCSAASASSNTTEKRIGKPNVITSVVGSSDLDESLCGDPLMYATFVAPVHQYSTETEPSRQASFNYPSRQPSFKQNSTDAETGTGAGSGTAAEPQQQGSVPQFPVNLPVPGSRGKSKTPDNKLYGKQGIQDIYEQVPVEQWPLPPLPVGHQEIDAQDEISQNPIAQECVQEVSQEELEHQAHIERMSFISGSSANEEEDDYEDNEDNEHATSALNFPPAPSAAEFSLMQPKSRTPIQPSHYHHFHQTYLSMPPENHVSGGREATPMIHKSALGLDDSSRRPIAERNEMIPTWGSAGDIDECLPSAEYFSSGTVRRKNKRERNRTNPEGGGQIFLGNSNDIESSVKIGVRKSNTSLESASDIPNMSPSCMHVERNPLMLNNIGSASAKNVNKRSKSRSKSRSPNRANTWLDNEMDIPPPPPPPHQVCHHHQSSLNHLSDQVHKHHQELSGSDGAAEIVIVHRGSNQTKCSLHPLKTNSTNPSRSHSASRNASPDNISDSSISFHENEFSNKQNQYNTSTRKTAPTSLKHKHAQDTTYANTTSRAKSNTSSKGISSERNKADHNDKYSNRENLGNYSYQSRLNSSGVENSSSKQDVKFVENKTTFLPKSHHYKQEGNGVSQQKHVHHHQKVSSRISYITIK